MHFYQPFVVLLAYIAFSSIYWAAGGVNSNGDSYIYPVNTLLISILEKGIYLGAK